MWYVDGERILVGYLLLVMRVLGFDFRVWLVGFTWLVALFGFVFLIVILVAGLLDVTFDLGCFVLDVCYSD